MTDLSKAKETTLPLRKLISGEMSKDVEDRQSSGNVVARLMGLEDIPQLHPQTAAPWIISTTSSRCGGSMSDKHLDLVRRKFFEAKGLVTDDKLHKSKEFQQALEVLSSNKDLFVKFLQESNSLFPHHHSDIEPVPLRSEATRITVLRPSNFTGAQKCVVQDSRSKQINKSASSIQESGWMDAVQPTRIVVLKPSSGKALDITAIASSPPSYFDEAGDAETREMAKEITRHVRESFKWHCRNETLSSSSALSNGYLADDSSLNRSNHGYPVGSISNSEIISPSSMHSWDFAHRFDSTFPCSSFSRIPVSPESSVYREAKKRLSKRWAMMSLNGDTQQQKKLQKSSAALGNMLTLSGTKVPTRSNEENNKAKQETRRSVSCIESTSDSMDTLERSKSVPEIRVNGGTAVLRTSKPQAPLELNESRSLKSSWKVSNLFFFRNKKANKEKTDVSLYRSTSQLGMSSDAPHQQNIYPVEGELQNQDQPSPVSVLQPPFEDPECSGSTKPWTTQEQEMSLKFNTIDKSPPIGSIARVFSWEDESRTDLTYPRIGIKEDEDWYDFIKTLLNASGFSPLMTLWHSPESPLDPSLRDKFANKRLIKRRKQRSNHKLMFDCVNAIIKTVPHTELTSEFDLVEHVWTGLKDWMTQDSNSSAGESVVRDEVVGKKWSHNLQMEVSNLGIEIEVKLLEEIVEEAVFDLAR